MKYLVPISLTLEVCVENEEQARYEAVLLLNSTKLKYTDLVVAFKVQKVSGDSKEA